MCLLYALDGNYEIPSTLSCKEESIIYIYIYSASIIKFPVNWLMSTTPRDLFEGFFFSILFQNPGYDFGVSLITPCIVGFS